MDTFVAHINTLFLRENMSALGADDNLFEECDSLELVLLAIEMETLGADLPTGIESTLPTLAELHGHLVRRLEGTGR